MKVVEISGDTPFRSAPNEKNQVVWHAGTYRVPEDMPEDVAAAAVEAGCGKAVNAKRKSAAPENKAID